MKVIVLLWKLFYRIQILIANQKFGMATNTEATVFENQ